MCATREQVQRDALCADATAAGLGGVCRALGVVFQTHVLAGQHYRRELARCAHAPQALR